MPTGDPKLHAKWGGDGPALRHLAENFCVSRGGIIYRRRSSYCLTDEDNSAIDYLFQEWDYGYDDNLFSEDGV